MVDDRSGNLRESQATAGRAGPGEDIHPRAMEVLQALTESERVAFLHQHQPAVPRLGLREFHTGTEVLHGLAWLGTATVFPQPVGLAATWDPDLIERVGRAAAFETLAAHRRDPAVSRNVWAPVVDPLRHPAWGRNEEGWSEDPHLTAQFAGAYARGLRGEGQWLTVPTLKHVLGYNNEDDRSQTSTSIRPRVLHEYELPAFLGPLRDGVAGALMPAYNLVNGRPAHVDGEMLDILRAAAPHPLLVVSDAYAPTNLAESQRFFADHALSHAAALRAGVDSFTDQDANSAITCDRVQEALDRGLIAMADVDRAVLRSLHVRAVLGDLDGQRPDGPGIDAPEHRELAREAAMKAVVLLRNDDVLPLADSANVALVGPMGHRVLTDWYSGTLPYAVPLTQALADRFGPDRVTVADGDDRVVLRSVSTGRYLTVAADGVVTSAAADPATASQLTWTDWGDGVITLTDTGTGLLWSAQGHGPVSASATRVGGWVAQESFAPHRHGDGTWSLRHLGSGRWLRIRAGVGTLAAEADALAGAERFVLHCRSSGLEQVRAAVAAADVAVVAVGNDPHLQGRETADRPHLRLPEPQAEIVRTAAATGTPVVLVVVSSYPYVLDAVARTSAAILWSSHAGQELGNALADVLTGASEPRGRLAQAWPEQESDAGDILDYDIIAGESTYWYSRAEPGFPFGHGLSWSQTRITATVAADQVDAGDEDAQLEVPVTVHNTGEHPVREVVQIYTDCPSHPLRYPRRLAAWAAVEVPAGGTRRAQLTVPASRLAVWDVRTDQFRVLSGTYQLQVGTSASNIHAVLEVRVDGAELDPRSLAGAGLRAETFDDQDGIVLGAYATDAGSCVHVAPGRSSGTVVYDEVLAVDRLKLEVGRTGPEAASVVVSVRTGPEWPWRFAGEVEVPDDPVQDWCWLEADLPAPDVTIDVRLTLHGAARVARLAARDEARGGERDIAKQPLPRS